MEFSKHKSIYMQIADYFNGNILLGKWKAGDKAPSVRQLAVDLEVNPNTVMRTYMILQDKSILINQRGIGFFVSEEAHGIVKEIVKEELLHEQLPGIFGIMEMLGISVEEIPAIYRQWKSNQKIQHP